MQLLNSCCWAKNTMTLAWKVVMNEQLQYAKRQEKPFLSWPILLNCHRWGRQGYIRTPLLVTSQKNLSGKAMKVRLVGTLEHHKLNILNIFTTTGKNEAEADHIVETLHRFVTDLASRRCLLETISIQMNKCTRDNSNLYRFAYMDSLLALSVFQIIRMSFLPTGHMQRDIEQSFSKISEWLWRADAIDLSNVQSDLRMTYQCKASVISRNFVKSWSDL